MPLVILSRLHKSCTALSDDCHRAHIECESLACHISRAPRHSSSERSRQRSAGLSQLLRVKSSSRETLLVKGEHAGEIPGDVPWEGVLGENPCGIRLCAIDIHLGHQDDAATIDGEALSRNKLSHCFNVGEFLPTELIGWV